MSAITTVLAIDPGTTQSGWVLLKNRYVLGSGVWANSDLLQLIQQSPADSLAVERFEARGMPIGDESVETMLWTGRFIQAWRQPDSVTLVKRSAVKIHLCGTARAKDQNIRQAVIDMLGPPGTKRAPGATHGVTSHAWSALAVAVTALELRRA